MTRSMRYRKWWRLRWLPLPQRRRDALAQGCYEAGDLAAAVDQAHELANLDFGYRDISRLLDDWQKRLEQSKVRK